MTQKRNKKKNKTKKNINIGLQTERKLLFENYLKI